MKIASYIDHTLLKAQATSAEIGQLCAEAKQFGFASVCVNPYYVAEAARLLAGSSVAVCTVIGFPLGMNTTAIKVAETTDAVNNGATEIDMVINVGALKERNTELVRDEIAAVVRAAEGRLVKVILETCLLDKEEIELASKLSAEAGAQFVKTSTGFSTGGATAEDVRLMKSAAGAGVKVKASGGVRDYAAALAMIEAGAERIGTSNGIQIATNSSDSASSGY